MNEHKNQVQLTHFLFFVLLLSFCVGLLLLVLLFWGLLDVKSSYFSFHLDVLFETKKEMYAESGLMFQSFSPEFDDFCYSYKLGSVVQSSTISDYDFGGEMDLFEAPKPIIDQPLTTLDPMTMITCGENNLSPQELNLTDIESLQNEDFFSNVFHEYKDILEKETETSPLSEVLNYKFTVKTDDSVIVKENVHPPGQIPKSVSSDCLSSMEWIHGRAQVKPYFLNITEEDFGNVYGMRRAFSEGDMKTLANGNRSQRNSSPGQPQLMSEHPIEDRWQKLSRYRNKKTKRNFGRKIKYACRKALADNQPRIRGRFAKQEESKILGK